MKKQIALLSGLLLFTSCGQLADELGLNEETKKLEKENKDYRRKRACLFKHDIAGSWSDGTETAIVDQYCKIKLYTCNQEGTITNLTSNSLTLNLPVVQDDNCLYGSNACSYFRSGNTLTLTCGDTVFSFTKQ